MKKFFLLLPFLLTPILGSAREPYEALIVVNSDSGLVSAPNLVDLKRELKTSEIKKLIPTYTETSQVAIGINLRGVEAITGFAANSTTLTLFMPDTGVTKTFTGSTRDESVALFKLYINDNGNKNGLLKAYARYSPIDPIAGNPNSLMTQMGLSDYALGRLYPLSGCSCQDPIQPVVHEFQVGIEGGRAFADGYDTTIARIPLRYSYSLNNCFAFILDAPFTYLRNGGASSLISSLGIGLRYQLTDFWSVTPVLRAGSGGSLDLVTSGNFVSAGITSNLNYGFSDYVLSITNYAGYITSANFWLTGINFNYHLQNYVFNNGIDIGSCKGFSICGRSLYFGASFLDSCFARDHLYISHFDEVSLSVSTFNLLPCHDFDALTLKLSYQFANHSYRGYFIKLDTLF